MRPRRVRQLPVEYASVRLRADPPLRHRGVRERPPWAAQRTNGEAWWAGSARDGGQYPPRALADDVVDQGTGLGRSMGIHYAQHGSAFPTDGATSAYSMIKSRSLGKVGRSRSTRGRSTGHEHCSVRSKGPHRLVRALGVGGGGRARPICLGLERVELPELRAGDVPARFSPPGRCPRCPTASLAGQGTESRGCGSDSANLIRQPLGMLSDNRTTQRTFSPDQRNLLPPKEFHFRDRMDGSPLVWDGRKSVALQPDLISAPRFRPSAGRIPLPGRQPGHHPHQP